MIDHKQETTGSVALKLGLCALVCMSTLGVIHYLTIDTITDAQTRQLEQQLTDVLAQTRFDNELPQDTLLVTDPLLGSTTPQKIWRARLQNRATGVVLSVTAQRGYNGPIELLVGISASGQITGVRTIAHQETPGLGDGIEIQRSDWILGFNHQSFDSVPAERWTVSKHGGDFDQFTGATITPMAVITAVHNALVYYRQEKDALFEH